MQYQEWNHPYFAQQNQRNGLKYRPKYPAHTPTLKTVQGMKGYSTLMNNSGSPSKSRRPEYKAKGPGWVFGTNRKRPKVLPIAITLACAAIGLIYLYFVLLPTPTVLDGVFRGAQTAAAPPVPQELEEQVVEPKPNQVTKKQTHRVVNDSPIPIITTDTGSEQQQQKHQVSSEKTTTSASIDAAKAVKIKTPADADSDIEEVSSEGIKVPTSDEIVPSDWTCNYLVVDPAELQSNKPVTSQENRDVERLSMHALLRNNQPAQGYVYENQYNFYQICLVPRTSSQEVQGLSFKIELHPMLSSQLESDDPNLASKGVLGDPDLYVSAHNIWPSVADAEFLSANEGSDELVFSTQLQDVPDDVDRLYVSVFGRSNTAYSIQVTVSPISNIVKDSATTRLRGA